MSLGFGFSLPALAQYGGGGTNPFGQLGPTLDLSFTGTAGNLSGTDTYTLDTNFITPQYQVAAQYAVWTATGLTQVNFADVVTFTRGSNATQFDSTGSLVYAPVNLLTWSEDFGNAAWTKQASVSIATNTTVAPNGTTTGDTVTADSGFGVFQQLAVTVGTQVTQSVYLRAGTATSIMFRDDTGAGRHIVVNPSTGAITSTSGTLLNSGSVSVGNGWYRIFFSYTADSTLVRNIIRPDSAGAAQTFIVWGGQTSLFPTLGGVTADFATYYPTTTTAYYGPRFDYNPATLAAQGLLIEEARTNSIRNNTMQGAVAGTPGTLPQVSGAPSWALGGISGGLATQVIGIGIESGIAYIDIRIYGTNSSGSSVFPGVFFETATGIAGTTGQVWAESVYLSLVAGTGLSFDLAVHEADSGGVFLRSTTIAGTSGVPTTGPLNARRRAGSVTLGASTAFVRPLIATTVVNGAAIDITLRIGLPQLENNNISTGVASATVAAGGTGYAVGDVLQIVGGTGSTAARLTVATLSGSAIATVTVSTAGSYSVFPSPQPVSVTAITGTGSSATFNIVPQTQTGFATSVIPTTTTALTRSADQASVNTLSPWYNATEGTLFAEGSVGYTVPGTAFPLLASLNDGTSNNRIETGYLTSAVAGFEVALGGVVQANIYPSTASVTRKVAGAYKANDFAACVNGGTVGIDTTGAIPVVDRLRIGERTGGNNINGYLRRIVYYPRRLANADLQTITT